MKKVLLTVLAVVICLSFASCNKAEKKDLWESAVYTENTTLGEGDKTFELTVTADEKKVVFTINTDKDNLEDALVEHKLIEGEDGAYGLYIKKVNGITADYDLDKSFWSLKQDGEPLMTSARGTEIKGGEKLELAVER